MFFRLLWESFRRQRRRKALAGLAILLGTTAVTAMLALATTIGDRIHKELAVYGANLVVTPKADLLDVKIGGVDIKPSTGGAYLKASDLPKLKAIFWANNITGVSPELPITLDLANGQHLQATGLWFHHNLVNGESSIVTGAPIMHPWWKLTGAWPAAPNEATAGAATGLHIGDTIQTNGTILRITGLVSTGDATDKRLLLPLETAQKLANLPDAVSRVDVSARTKPEDAFARKDPDTLSPQQHEIWYCRPYANSIAYQIREALPGAQAEQVRRV